MSRFSGNVREPLLISVFVFPETALSFDLAQWDLLIRQARRAGVLARLGFFLEKKNMLTHVPLRPLNHIKSAQILINQFTHALNWEIKCIQSALQGLNGPLILLKGAAYALAGNEAAQGRIFSDVDILVEKMRILDAESALRQKGWAQAILSDYDQKYYRKWMHESPPMSHVMRQTSIDVHHNILPKTAKFCPDANKLLANIVKIPERNIWVLAPEDRVIHSATHLFHEGELEHGFRDLSDLDLLLKEFSVDENFWKKLLQRAEELNQQIPLFYALRYTSLILQTPVPEAALKVSEENISGKIKQKFMDALFLRALMPDHQSCSDQWTGFARWLLFIRSHWLKMPWYLLIPHLFHKSVMRLTGKSQH